MTERFIEIAWEENEEFDAWKKKTNIYRVVEFGKDDAYYRDSDFIGLIGWHEFRLPTGIFIPTFLWYIKNGVKQIGRFASVKLDMVSEDMTTDECPIKYISVDKSEFNRIRWWNRLMYNGEKVGVADLSKQYLEECPNG